MNGFSLAWLRQREPYDLAARDRDCAARFAAALRQRGSRPLRVLDLASGSGASFRALAPLVGTEQAWTLTDNDAELLAAAGTVPAGDARWNAHGRIIDLARQLDELDFAAFDAVTTSAFLDLASQAWLDRLAAKLAAANLPLLATLSVDGRRSWHPALPDDAAILAAFEQHQASDKGFGAALGPASASHLAGVLRASAYEVTLARSDWRLGRNARAMLVPLLDDTSRAACAARPDQASAFSRWSETRRRQLAQGALSAEIGHLDLLALPPVASA